MFCYRPSNIHKLHWHNQHCYLCEGIQVKGKVNESILIANEQYRQLERHQCRRELTKQENNELDNIIEIWKQFSNIEREIKYFEQDNNNTYDDEAHEISPQDEALVSLNLAHIYFNDYITNKNINGQKDVRDDDDSYQKEEIKHQNLLIMCIKHTKKASKLGLSSAYYNLGLLYLWGGYIKEKEENEDDHCPNDKESVYYFRKACAMNYIPARYQLALMIRDGVKEAIKDDETRRKKQSTSSSSSSSHYQQHHKQQQKHHKQQHHHHHHHHLHLAIMKLIMLKIKQIICYRDKILEVSLL